VSRVEDFPVSFIKKMKPFKTYHKKFYSLFDYGANSKRIILDEGIVILFPQPKSFTGESKFENTKYY